MIRRISFNEKSIMFLILICPIVPRSLHIFGYSACNILILTIAMILIILEKKIQYPKIVNSFIPLLYLTTTSLCYLIHLDINPLLWFYTGTIILICLVYKGIKNEYLFFIIIDILIYTMGFVGILGIAETFTGFNIFDMISRTYHPLEGANGIRFGLIRSHGPFTTSINNSIYLGMGASLILYRISTKPKRIFTYIITYVIVITNCLLTISRAPIVAMIISQIIISIRCGVFKNPVKFITITGSIGIIASLIEVMHLFSITGAVRIMYYMVMAVFNEDYVLRIPSEYDMQKIGGVGDRRNLYSYILEDIKNKECFGLGSNAQFMKVINQYRTKTSLENFYLNILYHYGYLGLIATVLLIVGIIIYTIKRMRYKQNANFENKLSFNFLFFIITLTYFATLFTVNALDEQRTYCILIALLIAYNNYFAKKLKNIV